MKKRMRYFISYSLAAILLLVACLGVYTWLHHSPAGAVYPACKVAQIELPYRLRNGAEHDAARMRNGGNPYVLAINIPNGGALLYYGASHTSDPSDPQITDITERWRAFKPTVALYDGRRRGFFYGALIEPFAGLPKPALVHELARRNKVPLYLLEPAYGGEVAQLLQEFSAEQVALYFFLRAYTSEARGVARESQAMDLLSKRTEVEGLRGSLVTLDDVDRLWQRNFRGKATGRCFRVNRGIWPRSVIRRGEFAENTWPAF